MQLACPRGGEDGARRFWVEGLGLREVPKPTELAGRGGAWFRTDDGGVEVHVGVEQPFAPARKAHPALLLDDEADLEAAADRLASLGFEVDRTEEHSFPGHRRLHVRDAHENRVELLADLHGR